MDRQHKTEWDRKPRYGSDNRLVWCGKKDQIVSDGEPPSHHRGRESSHLEHGRPHRSRLPVGIPGRTGNWEFEKPSPLDRVAAMQVAAERGIVDAVIDPAETRREVAAALAMLANKRERLPHRKHGNTPL